MKKLITFLFGLLFLFSCTPTSRVYKVKFTDGSVEYYHLDYKVKKDAKSIEYEGETILGIEAIEEIK